MMMHDMTYLKLLSKTFPNIATTTTEIINLEAIMNLPKGTEHFMSDLHGEYEAFDHVLRSGSGKIKGKLIDLYNFQLSNKELDTLATLIYYPEEKMQLILNEFDSKEDTIDWYRLTLIRLIEFTNFSASKYTHSKVRKALPNDFAYIIEELLSKEDTYEDKVDYYNEIISSIIELGRAEEFIIALCYLIQRLVVDHLHVLGDIYDRGPFPHKIMDRLMEHHSVDIQWGNHDILWMGAASGSAACVANVLRISARYDNLEIIEDAYGISLRQLLTFAESTYGRKSNKGFESKKDPHKKEHYESEIDQLGIIQQAVAVIQFKLEGAIIKRNPSYQMNDRLLLDKINYDKGTIELDGKEYELTNNNFPTIDSSDPYKLSPEEKAVIDKLVDGFKESEALHRHIRYLISKGSMYLVYNGNLLFHGAIPMNPDGSFVEVNFEGEKYAGQSLLELFEQAIRISYFKQNNKENVKHLDLVWYLWSGPMSPLFGKNKMATFERYYLKDPATHKETKNPYFKLREDEKIAKKILESFGLDPDKGHIVNGHTPIEEPKGESPIKANKRTLVIDGGYSKAYQGKTGIGGYTLLYNSYGLEIATHQPFKSKKETLVNEPDIVSIIRLIDRELDWQKVATTDIGRKLKKQSDSLRQLLEAYRTGKIAEKHKKSY